MEEFRKFCASMAGEMAEINNLRFTNSEREAYSGADCLQCMADDVEKLNRGA